MQQLQEGQVSGHWPMWGRNDKTLYYQDNRGNLMEVSISLDPAPALGIPTMVVDRGKLRLFSGLGREYAVDIDGSQFLGTKSVTTPADVNDVGLVIVENWAKEFAN